MLADRRAVRDQPYRRLEGINTSEWLSQADYDDLLEDLSALTLRRRPVYPDHLHFDITLTEPLPTDAIIETCRPYGSLVEYGRSPKERSFSIHYLRNRLNLPVPVANIESTDNMELACTLPNLPSGVQRALRVGPSSRPAFEVASHSRF